MNSLLVVVALASVVGITTADTYCQRYAVFQFNSFHSKWPDARKFCRSRGLDLVKINHEEENGFLISFLRQEAGARGQDGWWIGGKYENGQWLWADGTPMTYKNFPAASTMSGTFEGVTNYAVIFKRGYEWGYLSPMSSNKLGIICESTRCSL